MTDREIAEHVLTALGYDGLLDRLTDDEVKRALIEVASCCGKFVHRSTCPISIRGVEDVERQD